MLMDIHVFIEEYRHVVGLSRAKILRAFPHQQRMHALVHRPRLLVHME